MIVTNVPHSVASPVVLNMYLACPTPPLVQQQDTAVVTGTGCSTAPSLPLKMHWMAHSSMCEHCQITLCAPQVNPDGTARTLAPDEPGFQDQVLEALQSVQQAYMASQVRNLKGPTEESLCSCQSLLHLDKRCSGRVVLEALRQSVQQAHLASQVICERRSSSWRRSSLGLTCHLACQATHSQSSPLAGRR